jgi:uncharacterized protein (TIGR02145 family)
LSVENPYLWSTKGGNKTAFDPCPEGWRIPKQEGVGSSYSPWANLDNNSLQLGVSHYTVGRYHADAGYYPFAGYISGGVIINTATHAYHWTSFSVNDTHGIGLSISNSDVSLTSTREKFYGVSVRCVVDANYLLNTPGGGLFGNSAGEMEGNIIP